MQSDDVPVALLGYGTVEAAVPRLEQTGDEIERATGHRLRVVRALVRDPPANSGFDAGPGVLTTDFDAVLGDPSIRLVAEVMGGVDPAGEHVLALLGSGCSVVTANKQLVARHGAELFAAASAARAQLRFEASVCAAIPVIKVLRESLVVTNVHRVVGIVNGTTNFILSAMSEGRSYADALAEAQRFGYAEADPTDDVAGLDAAAKTAILATVAFGSRVPLDWVAVEGIEAVREEHIEAARALDMRVKLLGRATRPRPDGRPGPVPPSSTPITRSPRSTGPFNAVMLQGDAIREITLEGRRGRNRDGERGRGRLVSIVGTTGTGFLQGDPVWRGSRGCRPATSPRRGICASRSRTARASSPPRPGARGRGRLRRAARAAALERSCACSTSSRTRPPPVGSRQPSPRSVRWPSRAGGERRSRSSRSAGSRSSAGRERRPTHMSL